MAKSSRMYIVGKIVRVIYTSSMGCFDHYVKESGDRWSIVEMQVSRMEEYNDDNADNGVSQGGKRSSQAGGTNSKVVVRGYLKSLSSAAVLCLVATPTPDNPDQFDVEEHCNTRFIPADGVLQSATVGDVVANLESPARVSATRAFAAVTGTLQRQATETPFLHPMLIDLVKTVAWTAPLRSDKNAVREHIRMRAPKALKSHASGILEWAFLLDGITHAGCTELDIEKAHVVAAKTRGLIDLLRSDSYHRLPASVVSRQTFDEALQYRAIKAIWGAQIDGKPANVCAMVAQWNACQTFVRWIRAHESVGGVLRVMPEEPEETTVVSERIRIAMEANMRGLAIVVMTQRREEVLSGYGAPEQIIRFADLGRMLTIPVDRRPSTIIVDSAHLLGYGQMAALAAVASTATTCVELIGCPALVSSIQCIGMPFSELCQVRDIPYRLRRSELWFKPQPLRNRLPIDSNLLSMEIENTPWCRTILENNHKGKRTNLSSRIIDSSVHWNGLVIEKASHYNRVIDEHLRRRLHTMPDFVVHHNPTAADVTTDLPNDYAHVGFFGPGMVKRRKCYVPLLQIALEKQTM